MGKGYIIMALLGAFCMIPCYAQKHQHGKASYYSKRATGARSASGQKIHHDSLTCAHKFYPFGTHLRVTNLSNGKSVIVKVIDRGPFGRGRIIDLSWAAAKEIGMLAQGVATVKVEMLENPIPYLPEDSKLPKIDFEMAETDYKDFTKWKKEKGAHTKEHPSSPNIKGKAAKDAKNKEEKEKTK
nr:septal ring lytic transglycosylase RlpA family protein [uncultured Prevotella sp.]